MYTTEENFLKVAKCCYDNVQSCSNIEFMEDMNRFMLLKKLFNSYHKKSKLNERLILNHLIILCNVFGSSATEFLFYKIPPAYHNYLATFLFFLSRIPESQSHKYNYDRNILSKLESL